MAESAVPAEIPVPSLRFGRLPQEVADYEWQKLVCYVAEGRSERTAAGLVGVIFEAIAEREATVPEFRAAMQDARSRRIGGVEDAFYESARSGDAKAQVEWLRNHDPAHYRRNPELPLPKPSAADEAARVTGPLKLSDRQMKTLKQLLTSVLGVGPDAPAPPRDVNPRPKRVRGARRAGDPREAPGMDLPPPGEPEVGAAVELEEQPWMAPPDLDGDDDGDEDE